MLNMLKHVKCIGGWEIDIEQQPDLLYMLAVTLKFFQIFSMSFSRSHPKNFYSQKLLFAKDKPTYLFQLFRLFRFWLELTCEACSFTC